MKKQRYQINGDGFTPENNEQLIEMIRIKVKTNEGRPLCVEPMEEESMYGLLEKIQEAAWEAIGQLSGVAAISGSIMECLSGDSLDDCHTLQHVAWLHIEAKRKIEEMQEAIEEAEHLENEGAIADRDIRKAKPVGDV